MFFWYLKITVIGKVQTSGLSSAATGKSTSEQTVSL